MTDTPSTEEKAEQRILNAYKSNNATLETENATLRARIAELTEWRPMETAPKDEKFIGWDEFHFLVDVCRISDDGTCYRVYGNEPTDIDGWLPLPTSKGDSA